MVKPNPGNGPTVTVRVPIALRKRGGRKLVLAPNGTHVGAAPAGPRIDSAIVKAIARAFRWREMLENGSHTTIAEIATGEKINESYVGRVLRLTLLAPETVEEIVTGRAPAVLQLHDLLTRLPLRWEDQRSALSMLRFCDVGRCESKGRVGTEKSARRLLG